MASTERLTRLTAGEISYLWTTYQEESLEKWIITYFLQHINDKQTESVLKDSLQLANKRITFIEKEFQKEHYAIPIGFTNDDVNLQAPRLFSDELYLEYVLNSSMIHLANYSLAMLDAVHPDIQQFYFNVIKESQKVEMEAKELSKKKGIYGIPSKLPVAEKTAFVKQDSFFSGLLIKRPLLGIEIAQLTFQAKRNALGQAFITAFGQVVESKELRKYFEKGTEMARKHFEIFSNILHDDYLPNSTLLWTSEITDATESPFSDKLMCLFITTLIDASIGSYSVSMAMSPRHDLTAKYARMIAEVAKYAQDGAKLTIKNGWMEQPPMAANRKDLMRQGG
jgi:hypothetical protein